MLTVGPGGGVAPKMEREVKTEGTHVEAEGKGLTDGWMWLVRSKENQIKVSGSLASTGNRAVGVPHPAPWFPLPLPRHQQWAQLGVTQLWGLGPNSTGRQKTELSRNVDEATSIPSSRREAWAGI